VITPIPKDGLGEVAALVGGQRYTAPAREAQGREVPRGAQVRVLKMVGSTLLVELS
jgi:membrane-bound ClpP family serine protease